MAVVLCVVPFEFGGVRTWTLECAGFLLGFRDPLFRAELACRDTANKKCMSFMLPTGSKYLFRYRASFLREEEF